MSDTRYHYKVVTVKVGAFASQEKRDQLIADKLNKLALEGYELVTVSHGYGSYPRLFLRR